MKLLGWGLVVLLVIGVTKGTFNVDLSSGGNAVAEIVGSVLAGIRDTTIMLIPNIIEGIKTMVDQVPDAA
ncbi:hypothetical protein MX572_25910 (plasmid) [Rhodococcus pyridinivorans]|uniref:hypothetical protein n=1 Tax=Rhodococcus TaxID=1827 RepID=UPI0007D9E0AE|nr:MULTISPECIES: hypothetical protein [Rhodococcus]APE12523.1 hypothetical protein BO226_24475 [Rhodococcus sp. 2G]UTM40085.1 hypothetical protein MX572_25910 [Rhodococcus pyridinivorans]WAL49581.1 hypothetical protein OQN32_27650 [Rhodococcus pyridinivorans]